MSHWQPQLRLLAFVFLAASGVLAGTYTCKLNRQLASTEPDPSVPPNYTLVEPGLYVGGQCRALPPDVQAVLSLSPALDHFTAPFYAWHPIPDSAPAPSLNWLREQVAFIDDQRQAGHTVFVHCDAGISRSGMVSAAYLMWRNHWTRAEALAFLRQTRPIIRPNAAFMELLAEWEKTVK